VGDGSIDFAFSFDSLVHVEADALASYVAGLARVLTEKGVAFLHHSNYGAYQGSARVFASLQGGMDMLPVTARRHSRGSGFTAAATGGRRA
jgi:hypothetical protein